MPGCLIVLPKGGRDDLRRAIDRIHSVLRLCRFDWGRFGPPSRIGDRLLVRVAACFLLRPNVFAW